ncbi:MAG: TonB-dependent receptor [Gammaproteobacteria bacterium]
MKNLTINKTMAIAMLLCLPTLDAHATGSEPVQLQMHIFSDLPPETDMTAADSESTKSMNMMIFSENEGIETYPAAPIQEDLRLEYAGDDAVVIQDEAEEEPQLETMKVDDMVIRFHANVGYRQDKLNWTIAAPSGSPNVLSELTWDNIESVTIDVGAKVKTESNWVLEGHAVYGEIIDGNNQDSDFFGDGRTHEFSRSNNNASDGNVVDLSLGLGYQFDIGRWRDGTPVWSLVPKVGASYHAQNFSMTDGVQTVETPGITPPLGNFDAILDNTYEAIWYGPWAGLGSELTISRYVKLWADFQIHYAYYEATANWNLRESFQHPESFTHEAEGTGIIAEAGSRFFIYDDLFMDITVNYQDWEADKKGIDTVFFADGSVGETRLNGVNWQSVGAAIGIHYDF